jgi:hypothetical protein
MEMLSQSGPRCSDHGIVASELQSNGVLSWHERGDWLGSNGPLPLAVDYAHRRKHSLSFAAILECTIHRFLEKMWGVKNK